MLCIQIPDTDTECRWDWRSTRCEPHCECKLQAKWGDYHLGRACRKRADSDSGMEMCEAIPPAERWQRLPATRRVVSLVTQTMDIIRMKVRHVSGKLTSQVSVRIQRWQDRTCGELWNLQKRQQSSVLECLPRHDVPQLNWRQQVACGPVEFRICDQPPSPHHLPLMTM